MKNKIIVTKASGLTEPFSIDKLRKSLLRSEATPDEIHSVIEALRPKLYQGISTQKIYSEAFRLLRQLSKSHAAQYYLKKGIMDLGPSGFPFEQLVGELFKRQGYAVEIGKILQGKCVTHEIDVIAEKESETVFVECKYRNRPGMAVDVKTPLYIHSRFEDVLVLRQNKKGSFIGCIATNAKFTGDAIDYALCKQMRLLSWDYPKDNSLRDLINDAGLYPLTCLPSLTVAEKHWLLKHNYVLAKEVYQNEKLLLQAGVKHSRLQSVKEDGKKLCLKKSGDFSIQPIPNS